MIIREFQEMLQNTPLFWLHIISVSEDAYGIKYIPFHMAILHQCNSCFVFKARNTVKQLWIIFYCLPHQRVLI